MAKPSLTAARLRELLHYDPESGRFRRAVDSYNRTALAGTDPCRVFKNGYIYIGVEGARYLAHRLAWLYVHGVWPDGDVDHINCDRVDNRIANLRDVNRRVNNENRRKTRVDNVSSGMTGVTHSNRPKPWRARIVVDGKTILLGHFETKEEAGAVYLAAKRSLHEGCTI